ncbi:zinc finger protein 568 isoform X1 [Nilaparvata lugens]|uniref:zinc finger protein 568 isoform X1 n=1 Tax=Nilaparvata lugens TaxID=108931 RepID=UPI00193D29C2|nr:zinc finger protein 568 isoform X1 [Nilaparvata lugens]
MPHLFSNSAIDVLSIFEKILAFFQDVGAFDAFLFDHSSIKYDPKLDIYLGRFVSLLEEIKVISDTLKTTDHFRTLTSHAEFTACDNLENFNKITTSSSNDLRDLLPTADQLPSSGQLLPAGQLPSSSQLLPADQLPNSGQLLRASQLPSSGRLLPAEQLPNSGQLRPADQLPNSGQQLISNHIDNRRSENIITFEDSLITVAESEPFVTTSRIDKKESRVSNNVDGYEPSLTPGEQLISSAIDGLVQEVASHDDNDDGLNNDEINFRPIEEQEETALKNIGSNDQWSGDNSQGLKSGDADKTTQANEKGSFTCAHCGKVLSSRTSLLKHINIHSGIKPYCCEHCGKLFTTNTNLSAHLTRQHNLNTESAKSCSVCGKLFVRMSALKLHLSVHRGFKPFKCSICDKAFAQKVTRDTHFLTHTRNYSYPCKVCPKRFPTKYKLSFHMKTHGQPQLACAVCDKRFATRQYLKAHYQSHNLQRSDAAPPPCRLDTSTPQVIEAPPISCPQCDLTFRSQRALTRHTRAKHEHLIQWYYCKQPDCPRPTKAFPTKYQLTKHNDRHHSQHTKKFVCKTCGKSFVEKNSLMRHQRQNHMVGLSLQELKPYSCHVCSKRFFTKSKMTVHMSTHAENPQFRCELCTKSFYRKDSLKKHFKERHSTATTSSEPSQAQFSCSQCGKNFKSQSALVFHLQTHNGDFKFQCENCNKCFVRKCHFESHMRSHSESRPYKCSTCGRGFKEKKHWKVHLRRVHTNEITMQSLLDSITSEAALCTDNTDMMHHPVLQANDCLAISQSYIINAGIELQHM